MPKMRCSGGDHEHPVVFWGYKEWVAIVNLIFAAIVVVITIIAIFIKNENRTTKVESTLTQVSDYMKATTTNLTGIRRSLETVSKKAIEGEADRKQIKTTIEQINKRVEKIEADKQGK